MFKSLSHFKFIFVHDVRVYSNFIDFTCSFPAFPAPLAKRLSFFLFNILASFVENCTCVFISGLSILFHMSVFVPIPHSFDYCNFGLKLRRVMPPALFFPQVCFGSSGSFMVPFRFGIIFSSSVENVMDKLIGVTVNR